MHNLRNMLAEIKALHLNEVQSRNPSDQFSIRRLKRLKLLPTFVTVRWQSWNYKENIIIIVQFIDI